MNRRKFLSKTAALGVHSLTQISYDPVNFQGKAKEINLVRYQL